MSDTQSNTVPRERTKSARNQALSEYDKLGMSVAEREAMHEARKEVWRISQLLAKARTAPEITDAVLADVYEMHALQAISRAEQALPDADYTAAINGATKAMDRALLLRGRSSPLAGPKSVEEKRAALIELLQERTQQSAIDVTLDNAHDSDTHAHAREADDPDALE